MKLRKFNDFKRIYENNVDLMMEPGEPEELEMSGTETKPGGPQTAPPTIPIKPEKPQRKVDPNKIEQPSKDPDRKAFTDEEEYFSTQSQFEEEEEYFSTQSQFEEEEEYTSASIDTMIQEISDELGVSTQGGGFEIDGVKFEFQSEPMCFAVNGKTMKHLKTSDDVINFVNSGKHKDQTAAQAQRRPQAQAQGMQRTQTTTQMPGQAPSQTGGTGGQQRIPMTQPMQEKFRRKY
jgi:hypothetical protein